MIFVYRISDLEDELQECVEKGEECNVTLKRQLKVYMYVQYHHTTDNMQTTVFVYMYVRLCVCR